MFFSDCEFREPGGGYRMADQSSARPKWIPCYERREFKSHGKEHTTKWSSVIFDGVLFVTKDEFVEKIKQMEFIQKLMMYVLIILKLLIWNFILMNL